METLYLKKCDLGFYHLEDEKDIYYSLGSFKNTLKRNKTIIIGNKEYKIIQPKLKDRLTFKRFKFNNFFWQCIYIFLIIFIGYGAIILLIINNK